MKHSYLLTAKNNPDTEVDKFISKRPIFRARDFTCTPNRARKKIGAQNQSACPIEKYCFLLFKT